MQRKALGLDFVKTNICSCKIDFEFMLYNAPAIGLLVFSFYTKNSKQIAFFLVGRFELL